MLALDETVHSLKSSKEKTDFASVSLLRLFNGGSFFEAELLPVFFRAEVEALGAEVEAFGAEVEAFEAEVEAFGAEVEAFGAEIARVSFGFGLALSEVDCAGAEVID